jgi:hypothetical protein
MPSSGSVELFVCRRNREVLAAVGRVADWR